MINNFKTRLASNAITMPITYNPIMTNPCKLKNPKYSLSSITNDIKIVYTGNLALQLINGVTMIVSNLSFLFSILRALIIAGTAQANPLIMGITLFPLRPTLRMSLSLKKLIRAMYPVSSSNVIKPNRIMI